MFVNKHLIASSKRRSKVLLVLRGVNAKKNAQTFGFKKEIPTRDSMQN